MAPLADRDAGKGRFAVRWLSTRPPSRWVSASRCRLSLRVFRSCAALLSVGGTSSRWAGRCLTILLGVVITCKLAHLARVLHDVSIGLHHRCGLTGRRCGSLPCRTGVFADHSLPGAPGRLGVARKPCAGGEFGSVYRTITLVLPVAHDDVYDYVVAGASGPDRIVLVLSARQWEYRPSAQRAVSEILGGAYHLRRCEPPHRIDFELVGWSGIHGMIVCGIAGRAASSLTLYLTADPTGWRRMLAPLQRRRIDRISERAHRLPAVVRHPSWPGAWSS